MYALGSITLIRKVIDEGPLEGLLHSGKIDPVFKRKISRYV